MPTNRQTNETPISGLTTKQFVKFCLKGSRRNYQYESLVCTKYYFEKTNMTGSVTKQLIVFGLKIQYFKKYPFTITFFIICRIT